MAYKTIVYAKENGQVDYSAKVSNGTQWAREHVKRTFKQEQILPCSACNGTGSDCNRFPIEGCAKCNGNGNITRLVMLTPPPMHWKPRHEK